MSDTLFIALVLVSVALLAGVAMVAIGTHLQPMADAIAAFAGLD